MNRNNRIKLAIKALQEGRAVIVTDDEDRENEGDFVAAGSTVSYETVNLMVSRGRGVLCVPAGPETIQRLELLPMVDNNGDPHKTAFTVSVDAADATTGISVAERLRAIQLLADPTSSAQHLRKPGHVFPLAARNGGLAERRGHTEAAVELAKLAGLPPVGVVCEILADDGSCMRTQELHNLASELDLIFLTIEDLSGFLLAEAGARA